MGSRQRRGSVATRGGPRRPGADLVITNAAVWAEPDAEPVLDGRITVTAGRIGSVERMSSPVSTMSRAGVPVLDARGRIVTAGFWNCHVHLTEPVWSAAGRADALRLQSALDDMLVSRGFTTVVDLASNSRDTLPLIARIESGELTGPTIYTATEAICPARGLPFYTKESLPWYLWWAIPTPWTARGASRVAARQLRRGAGVIKLFTGSYVERDRIKVMAPRTAAAAAAAAHQHGVLVFAHTSNHRGLRVALDAGVDVIAHVPDETDGTADLLRTAAARGVRMIPTLQMFARTVTDSPSYLDPIDAALRIFIDAGGRVLFGTDVGYMSDYDPVGELTALQRCGMDSRQILRSLTTEPAAAFTRPDLGTIESGKCADLTMLSTTSLRVQPADLAGVAAVVKNGRIIFSTDERDRYA